MNCLEYLVCITLQQTLKDLMDMTLGPNLDSCQNLVTNLGPRSPDPLLEMTLGFNLESCPNQLWLLSDFQKTSDAQKTIDFLMEVHQAPKLSLRKILDDDTNFQFGELSRSALQIWLLIDSYQTFIG